MPIEWQAQPNWNENKKEPFSSQGFDHLLYPQDLDRSLDIVTQNGQGHLSPDIGKLAGQEMALVPMMLEGSEWVFGQLFSQFHLIPVC